MEVIRGKSKEIMNAFAIDVNVFFHVPHGPHQASSCNPCFLRRCLSIRIARKKWRGHVTHVSETKYPSQENSANEARKHS